MSDIEDQKEINRLNSTIRSLKQELTGLQNTFDLMWEADMRAVKLWQEATGEDHIWPDRTKTTIWLLEKIEALEDEVIKNKEGWMAQVEQCSQLSLEIDRLNSENKKLEKRITELGWSLEAERSW